jgi:hypothetical protein
MTKDPEMETLVKLFLIQKHWIFFEFHHVKFKFNSSLVGSCRRGKSWFANVLHGRHDGFNLGAKVEGCTRGYACGPLHSN